MIVNLYTTSLLKHINIGLLRKSLPKDVILSTNTCYTLKEVNAFKHDQGKALETVVIPDVKKTNANLVCLENGVNEATKIAKTPFNLTTKVALLKKQACRLVDFAEEIIANTNCRTVALIKMMPRFDKNVATDDARKFLSLIHI